MGRTFLRLVSAPIYIKSMFEIRLNICQATNNVIPRRSR